jgi:hypothetical protein
MAAITEHTAVATATAPGSSAPVTAPAAVTEHTTVSTLPTDRARSAVTASTTGSKQATRTTGSPGLSCDGTGTTVTTVPEEQAAPTAYARGSPKDRAVATIAATTPQPATVLPGLAYPVHRLTISAVANQPPNQTACAPVETTAPVTHEEPAIAPAARSPSRAVRGVEIKPVTDQPTAIGMLGVTIADSQVVPGEVIDRISESHHPKIKIRRDRLAHRLLTRTKLAAASRHRRPHQGRQTWSAGRSWCKTQPGQQLSIYAHHISRRRPISAGLGCRPRGCNRDQNRRALRRPSNVMSGRRIKQY